MKKIVAIILFLGFFLVIMTFDTTAAVTSDIKLLHEGEVKAKIMLEDRNVTTKNLDEKLLYLSYQLRFATVKKQLSYLDETIIRKLEDLSFSSMEQLEADYQQLLKSLGLHEDLDKFLQYGVPLESITVLMKGQDLYKKKKKGYQVVVI